MGKSRNSFKQASLPHWLGGCQTALVLHCQDFSLEIVDIDDCFLPKGSIPLVGHRYNVRRLAKPSTVEISSTANKTGTVEISSTAKNVNPTERVIPLSQLSRLYDAVARPIRPSIGVNWLAVKKVENSLGSGYYARLIPDDSNIRPKYGEVIVTADSLEGILQAIKDNKPLVNVNQQVAPPPAP